MFANLFKKIFGSVEEKQQNTAEDYEIKPYDSHKSRKRLYDNNGDLIKEIKNPHNLDYERLLYINRAMEDLEFMKVYRQKRILPFDFIPKQQANFNVRSHLQSVTNDYKAWQVIRKVMQSWHSRCIVCNRTCPEYDKELKHLVECHEQWSFNSEKRIQTLEDIKVYCVTCHMTAHLDQHIENKNMFNWLIRHYAVWNKIKESQARNDYEMLLKIKNNQELLQSFDLDITYLKRFKNFGIPQNNLNRVEYKNRNINLIKPSLEDGDNG